MSELKKDNRYIKFLETILDKIQIARIDASQKVNLATMELYYSIGNLIVEKQAGYGWGSSVVEQLSNDLQEITDATISFSERNLWLMKQMFVEYKEHEHLLKYVFNIPWGQNIVILQKIKDYKAREYYLKATAGYAWGRTVLINQIKANAYEYHLENPKQHNFNETLPKHHSEQADLAMKSVYNLEILGINKPIHERQMEKRMVEKIKDLLMELGYGFTFIGNQYKLKGNTKDYFIDLLFYHRGLRCLVAIELKTGEYKSEYAGKLNLYLNLLDNQVKMKDENPSIGIILCAEKDSFEVEFSLKDFQKPIGVAEYHLTKELPDKLKGKLPSAIELKDHLKDKYGFEKTSG
jgi:predicted nuclease of restriction endonuclease-like (RecB) superfamily